MFMILKTKKSGIEATLLALSFGPLMFLDPDTAGSINASRWCISVAKTHRWPFIVGAFATHVIAVSRFC